MRRYVERAPPVEHFVKWLALGVVMAVLVAWAFAYLMVRPAWGAETYRVPAACVPLAHRYGFPEVLTREQAISARIHIERYRVWPGVSVCRTAVIREWKL